MVKFLGVKLSSIPLEGVLFLLGISYPTYYFLLTFFIIMTFSKRIKSVDQSLAKVGEDDQGNVLKNIKLIRKIWIRIEDLINSMEKYFMSTIIFYLLNYFLFLLVTIFLAYDVGVHNLEIDDKIFLCICITLSLSATAGVLPLTSYSKMIGRIISTAIGKINLIRLKCDDKKVQKNCELAILQFEHSRKLISCEMFELDWKFIFSMMSSVFSFLLTMVQFDYVISTRQLEI